MFYLAKEMSLENIRQVPLIDYEKNIYYLSTAMMNGISYVVPSAGMKNYKDIQDYVHKMFSSDPAVREDAEILVLNGSGVPGVAAAEQTALKKENYTSVSVGDAPTGDYPQHYYLYDISGETPGTLEVLSKKYGIEAQSKDSLPTGITTTGVDIVLIIGEEPAAEE